MGFLRNLFAGGVPEPTAGTDCDCTYGYVDYCPTCEEWVDE